MSKTLEELKGIHERAIDSWEQMDDDYQYPIGGDIPAYGEDKEADLLFVDGYENKETGECVYAYYPRKRYFGPIEQNLLSVGGDSELVWSEEGWEYEWWEEPCGYRYVDSDENESKCYLPGEEWKDGLRLTEKYGADWLPDLILKAAEFDQEEQEQAYPVVCQKWLSEEGAEGSGEKEYWFGNLCLTVTENAEGQPVRLHIESEGEEATAILAEDGEWKWEESKDPTDSPAPPPTP
jgi:hypothetical protein